MAAKYPLPSIRAAAGLERPPFAMNSGGDTLLSEIDKWAYEYFCLSHDEVILIEDMIDRIIPAVQPHQGSFPELWKAPTEAGDSPQA